MLSDYKKNLKTFLIKYVCKQVIHRASGGTRIGYTDPTKLRFSKNFPSAYKNAAIFSETLAKEVALGRVAGPFNNPNLQVSSLV